MSADAIDVDAREATAEDAAEPGAPQAYLPAVAAPLLGEVPTVPAANELQTLGQLARTFAMAELVPSALREKPADCLLVLMTARDLGLSITVAFREMHVIEGKVTCSPKLRKAIVAQRGLGRVWPAPDNDAEHATWYAIRADMPDVTWTSTFTMEDAKLVPAKERGATITLDRKSNWKAYPKRMLSWRALGYLLDDAFSEVGTGLYSPDEMGAITDQDGQPVLDVMGAEPMEGMANRQQQRQQERQAATEATADPAALWELQATIKALPDQQRNALMQAWMAEDSRLRGRVARDLPAGLLRAAKAMVNAYWGEAVKAGADKDTAIASLHTVVGATVVGWLCAWGAVRPQDDQPSATPHPEAPQADTAADSPEPEADGDDPAQALEARAAKAKWLPLANAVAEEVRSEAANVPGPVVAEIGAEVKAAHHSHINAAIEAAGFAADYPPDSPIDLRRMVVTLLRLQAWQAEHREQGQ